MSLKIALDYDDTFTADKTLWVDFVHNAVQKGHKVTFVTFRDGDPVRWHKENADIEWDAQLLSIPIMYTAGKQKTHCFDADIWIDDSPHMIASYTNMIGMVKGCEQMGDLGL